MKTLTAVFLTAIVVGSVVGYATWTMIPPSEVPVAKPYEDYHIIVITGDEADPFTIPIAKGANDAAEHFGCDVDVYFSEGWRDESFLTNLRTAIALHPDGIAFCPLGGYAALDPEIATAYDEGIVVSLMNVDVEDIRKKYTECGYIGQEIYSSGYTLGETCITKYGFGEGDRAAVFSGAWAEPERAQRAYGVMDALEAAGMTVDQVDHPSEVYGDPGTGLVYVSGYVSAYPDVKLIVFDGGGTTSAVDTYMSGIGKAPGEIKTAGFDLTPGALSSIQAGYLQLTLDQQPYLYGYLTTLNLLLTIKLGIMGLYIDTGGGIVDENNVALVADLADQGYR